MDRSAETIAIIGAGFTGSGVTVQLLRLTTKADISRIVLIDRDGCFGPGVAYRTLVPSHVLNVPAGRMSAFDDDPDHFVRWVQESVPQVTGASFLRRSVYGTYLREQLDRAVNDRPDIEVRRVAAEAVSIRSCTPTTLRISLDDGSEIEAHRIVIATGNHPSASIRDGQEWPSHRYTPNPWVLEELTPGVCGSVLLLGTGLTMFDVALSLRDTAHRTIYACSRRGLLPQRHRAGADPPTMHAPPPDLDESPPTAVGLLRAVRLHARRMSRDGIDWRDAITSLRPETARLWGSLANPEKLRFLRHLRPYWDTHRHRAAPEVADAIDEMIGSGRVIIVAGRVRGFRELGHRLRVAIAPRGESNVRTIEVDRVINCTGPETDVNRIDDRLIRTMLQVGLARRDASGLGLQSSESGNLIDRSGRESNRLFLVGSLRMGLRWENTSVPELRTEVRRLAATLVMFSRMAAC